MFIGAYIEPNMPNTRSGAKRQDVYTVLKSSFDGAMFQLFLISFQICFIQIPLFQLQPKCCYTAVV